MSAYEKLLADATVVLERNALAAFITGFTPPLINQLMQNHIEKVRAADSRQATIKMLNAALSAQLGIATTVDKFIPKEQDRETLHDIFKQWREQLLAADSNEREV